MNYGEMSHRQALTAKEQRQSVSRYLANETAREYVLERIAGGEPITRIAEEMNLPYSALYAVLTRQFADQYRAAKAALAESLAEKNLAMADRVENLELPHDVAKAAAGIRHWYMERASSENWGQRSTVDMNVKGVVGLHLEAIRELSKEPIEGDFTEVEEDEYADAIADRDDLDSGDDPDDDVGAGRLKGEDLL